MLGVEQTTSKRIPVYECKGKRVILLGQCGDNFGSVQCIDSGEEFTTYGYNTMNFNDNTKIGTVVQTTVKTMTELL